MENRIMNEEQKANQENPLQNTSNMENANQNPAQGSSIKRNGISLTTILSLCLIISVLIAGFFVYQNFQLKKMLTVNIQPTPPAGEPTPTATPDPTADWKMYTFKPIMLTLKVPEELTVHSEEPNPGKDFTAYIQNYPFNAPYPKENAYQLYIIWQKTPSVSQEEFTQLKTDLDMATVEDTSIDGYLAIKGQVKGQRNRFVTHILFKNTKISLFTSDPTETNKKLTDQILSTFKFTKTTPTPSAKPSATPTIKPTGN